MKGGITSGIVYPNAVLSLARQYRFKNIGGTSAGAIAAAVAAAAALGDRRRHAGQPVADEVGFPGLAAVSAQLSTRGFIYRLFQPAHGARTAYRLLVMLTGKSSLPRKAACLLAAVFAIAPLELLASLLVLLGIGWLAAGSDGIWATLLPSLLCAYGAGVLASALRVARVARRNLLGLCSGATQADSSAPALTDWLHTRLQALAGMPLDQPLTFGDLHHAPRYDGEPVGVQAISLQMITTCVSHTEPRTLPFSAAHFWFLREEFAQLFPASVVDWLVARAGAPERVDGREYYRLVDGEQLPVLVATRMSLSFPLLISAVPLHEPARRERRCEPPADTAAPRDNSNVADSMEGLTSGGQGRSPVITAFRVCWFSDGGISSNFPIHLFDAALPRWPTFGINLVYPRHAEAVSMLAEGTAQAQIDRAVFLPTENRQGWQRSYQSIARPLAAAELSGFLFSIVSTMQNWRDVLQARAPGYRDRIVHVSLQGDEGGMNLDMPQQVLSRIAAKGSLAGERFYGFSFQNHFWIRWRNLASAYQRYTLEIARTDDPAQRVAAWTDAYQSVASGQPPAPSYRLSSEEKRRASQQLWRLMVEQGQTWEDLGPDLTDGAPRPLPQMKVTPIY
ncbi:patatin-like phospholipase family protein [Stenotrophomonas rhizophila]|uniref:patatin-like phospholipase family protein n=1 Tax=Stenotrophomonas rhizophila TaxID=216778 RepID=UPI001E2E4834|nr:patatin-like phospholipase family protein [Stenotrophomonas rhizophila]MCC7633082.1 patatin-like phospholipase family protein [Stenotrophomonas rhizophila]MCC7661975.1 patatin-like phospholipase family protein [Stenotrophomonas rhizophila]